jgi:hypothetical protein
METAPLNAKNVFNLTDLILDLADCLLDGGFIFQIWIIDNLSRLFLNGPLHVVKRALRLILGTGFHGIFLLKILNTLSRAARTVGIRELACRSSRFLSEQLALGNPHDPYPNTPSRGRGEQRIIADWMFLHTCRLDFARQ